MTRRSSQTTKPLVLLMTVPGLAFLMALIFGGPPAVLAQGEVGDYCVGAHQPDATCTAADTPFTSYTEHAYINDDICTIVPGDTATLQVLVEIHPGNAQRSDFGIFVALDGGSAIRNVGEDGWCYHDYLAPPAEHTEPIPVPDPSGDGNCPCPYGQDSCTVGGFDYECEYNPGTVANGGGPWFEADFSGGGTPNGDVCGDVELVVLEDDTNLPTFFQTAPLLLPCNDTDANGLLDPVSVCVSWDNQNQDNCTGLSDAFPNTKSKCKCAYVDIGALIYEGIDYGDLPHDPQHPPGHPETPYKYKATKESGGPGHAIHQDLDSDGLPDADGNGNQAVWLGAAVETEANGNPSVGATGDGLEEDGIVPTGNWSHGTGAVNVTVSTSSDSGDACLNAWMDFTDDFGHPRGWGDGDFYDLGEAAGTYDSWADGTTIDEWVIENRQVSAGTTLQSFDLPNGIGLGINYYMRFRLTPRDADGLSCTGADAYQGGAATPQGLAFNGEVEDYRVFFGPTAVTLSSFVARPSPGGRVAVALAALAVLVAALLAGFALVRRRGWIGG